jgi:hypothetical protein
MMPIFTQEELDDYTIDQLRRLAQYFSVPTNEKMSKGRLIEIIYKKLEDVDRQERNIDTSPASVRIQRIRNSK